MSSFITNILEKMGSRDKDFQYMAVSDLATELEKESFKFEANVENRVVLALLNLLKGSSNNIQELAVKCLGPLVRKVKDTSVQDILETLTDTLLNEKSPEELRDISSMGLKAAIGAISPDSTTLSGFVHKRFTPRLVQCLPQPAPTEVKVYCLDIIVDLLTRSGRQMNHDSVQKAILPLLTSNISPIRKRCIVCVGLLSSCDPDPLFSQLVEYLLEGIKTATKPDHIRTLIQCIAAIGGSVGFRISRYLPTIVPMLIKYCENPKFDQDDELRENCFQVFEVLSLRCHKEMSQYISDVLNLALKFIKYDPNYTVDDDDENEDMDTDDPEEEDQEDTDYSDDDDLSWKVRRSSTKCLAAIITTRIDLIHDIYTQAAPVLIARFKEREENVKLDIFRTFIDLLRQTAISNKRSSASFVSTTTAHLTNLLPKIVSSMAKQLKQKSIKIRAGAFCLLQELVTVLPGTLSHFVSDLIPGILFSLRDKVSNSNLKVETLVFLRLLLQSHSPASFYPHIEALAPFIMKAMADSYYRIAAEGLRVGSQLITTMRTKDSQFNYHPFIAGLYSATFAQLKAQDIDQEVKECALSCMGTIVAVMADELQAEIPNCLHLLLDRLKNEITRLTAIKVLAHIAESSLHIDLSPILADTFGELSNFLRKSNRQLRQSSLLTLSSLFEHYSTTKAAQQLSTQILTELCPLITDNDLFLSYLALQLCAQILRSPSGASVVPLIQEKILPQTLELTKSSLLQGVALSALLTFFGQLVSLNSKVVTFEYLIEALLSLVMKQKDGPTNKQCFSSVAQCVSALCINVKSAQRDAVVQRFIKEFQKGKDEAKLISLLSLGEIGRRVDLSHHEPLLPLLLGAFESPSEEIKQAASFALGNVAVGSMEKLLPFVLSEIIKQPHRQYLLLHSLREIIIRQSTQEGVQILSPHIHPILQLLCAHCESDEEGTRNVVAECLGKLALLVPNEVFAQLDEKLNGPPFARSTVVTAIKYAVSESPQIVDTLLSQRMPRVLSLLGDAEPLVRRSVLLTLNYTAHHKPDLIREILPSFLPQLYNETKIKPELIKEVDLGPFKHKVDGGLDIRKNAYECMYTFLDTSIHKLDISVFVQHVAQGMTDHYDIKMLAHLMIIRLAGTAGLALLEGVDFLVDPLRDTITSKANDTDVKQEIDRHEELVRSALRAVAAIAKITGSDSVPRFRDFMRQVVLGPNFIERYKEISKEDLSASGSDSTATPMEL